MTSLRAHLFSLFLLFSLIPFAIICTPAPALAKKGTAAPPTAPASATDVDAVEGAYRALQDLTAQFTQTTQVALVDRTVTRNGTFRFKKGGKLRIEYEGKEGKHYVSDGTTLWIYLPGDDASLQTFKVNDETVPKEALSFLSGFGKLTKEFSVASSAAFPDAPAGATALRLTPRSGSRHFESLDALFGPDHLLCELVIRNASGNVSHYRFKDIKTNAGLPDSLFTLSSGKATPDTLPE